jgi:hypothetical protein
MQRRALLAIGLAIAGAALWTVPASAHHSPAGCRSNDLQISISRDRSSGLYSNGEIIQYALKVSNMGPLACDITGATFQLTLPAKDGTPTGRLVVFSVNRAIPANTAEFVLGEVNYTIDVNEGVADAVAEAAVPVGLLHDIPVGDHDLNIRKTIGTRIVPPSIDLVKVGSITNGVGTQPVTYTYTVTNTSTTPIPIENVVVVDDLCPNPIYTGGDTNNSNALEITEAWTFSCTTTHAAPGTYVNTAYATGRSKLDARPVRSPNRQWTVVLTVTPQSGVRPAQADRCTLSTPNGLKVRAGEMNTIRVRTRNVDAGSLVRITLPGGRVLRDRTDRNGIAVFRVRPPRSGTAQIRAAECAEVERLSVRQARRVVSRRVPRVTG